MPDVTFQREDYKHHLSDWKLVASVVQGERAVKSSGYLPYLNEFDDSDENKDRNKKYAERAVFYNATRRTLQGLNGAVFKKWPTLTTTTGLQYLEDNADGCGVSIYQQAQHTLAQVLSKGRFALLVDYPRTEKVVTLAEQSQQNIQANIQGIDSDNVINWRIEKSGGIHRLTLVVIEENYTETTADGFGIESETQYRVLLLREGIYTVDIWRDIDGQWQIVETQTPVNGSGQPWQIIPFIFIGAQSNSADIDDAPLLDLARLNIAHFRNSADYEDSVFYVGQAQPFMSGMTVELYSELKKDGVYVGSREAIPLPEGGTFGFAQPAPNSLVKEAMDQKESQMVALGARLIEKGQAVKTATEAQSENEAQHSVLSLVASNVSEAYTQALQWCGEFMNASGEHEFTLNQDFIEHTLDAPMLDALIRAWQSGRLPSGDLWARFRRDGLIDPEKTDEDIQEELNNDPSGLGLDNDE